ncbi:putative DNA-binding domain [Carpediemonas membranifera]|uniref:KAT8 regulatory NSL complex subunit 2 n=1 Tax=Carpediemonas membranifera TaxID=201153 RepID=A0A8J6AWW0_9EUKA|nr:putative DNA-binding domain [Carpediemonas membranifera]|eukprot:KAG9390333.1 putative DNA-binding domain [Carpediemonas membranifera]
MPKSEQPTLGPVELQGMWTNVVNELHDLNSNPAFPSTFGTTAQTPPEWYQRQIDQAKKLKEVYIRQNGIINQQLRTLYVNFISKKQHTALSPTKTAPPRARNPSSTFTLPEIPTYDHHTKCCHSDCTQRALPLCQYCPAHMAADKGQHMYTQCVHMELGRRCQRTVHGRGRCVEHQPTGASELALGEPEGKRDAILLW